MELKTAIAKVEGMKNLFRAFESVEEVLRLAASAEQIAKERNEFAARMATQIEESKGELSALAASAEGARASMERERQEHERAVLEAEKKASEMRAKRLQEFESNFTHAMQIATAERARLEAANRALGEEHVALELAVNELKDELNRLKSRIAGV